MSISQIVTNSIADSAVVTVDIANGAVTQAKLGTGVAGNGPAFSAYNSTSQTIPFNTVAKINFDTEEFDTNNNFASSRFTPTVAGYYQMNSKLYFTGTGLRNYYFSSRFYKNGSLISVSDLSIYQLGSAANASVILSQLIYMNGSTDYLEVYTYNYDYTASSDTVIAGGLSYTQFSGSLARAA
jgi:hypothetical protein